MGTKNVLSWHEITVSTQIVVHLMVQQIEENCLVVSSVWSWRQFAYSVSDLCINLHGKQMKCSQEQPPWTQGLTNMQAKQQSIYKQSIAYKFGTS